MNKTFEECYKEIEAIVEKKRYDWTFKASLMEDFDDVKNEILVHIWEKWHLYDQSRSLGSWVSTISKNQFKNKLRNVYQSISSPCLRCSCCIGEGMCSLYENQDVECKLYKKWYNKKRYAHDVKQPLSLENHAHEVKSRFDTIFNLEASTQELHRKMKSSLTPSEFAVYDLLYIKNLSEAETVAILGLKEDTDYKGHSKRIRQIKSKILKKTKSVLQSEGANSYL